MNRTFHKLTVASLRKEIGGEATSVTLSVPPELGTTFHWHAGQHLPLRFMIGGKEHRRCYTISNPPAASLRITVKRVKGGAVSNYIAKSLEEGSTVEAMPPSGRFTLQGDPLARRTHYFFGAGSGITPLFAMIHQVLEHEPHSVAHLIFGNKSTDSILFRQELDTLAEAHPDRLTLRHVLSSPSVWSWFSPWRTGRITPEAISAIFAETPPVAQNVQYWICGPGAMNTAVRDALTGLDVPANRIHMESFGGSAKNTGHSIKGVAATASVTIDGVQRDIQMAEEQTLLEAALASGLNPPYSCQSGVCGACKAKITGGKIRMRAQMALDESEIEQGSILTCQSVAETQRLTVEFPA